VLGFSEPTVLRLGEKQKEREEEKKNPLLSLNTKTTRIIGTKTHKF